jgi:hypothetical protein
MKRHPFDPISLALGATFALLGFILLAAGTGASTIPLDSLWPIPLIGLGLAIVFVAIRRTVPTRAREEGTEDDGEG